jgi:ribonuclease PH
MRSIINGEYHMIKKSQKQQKENKQKDKKESEKESALLQYEMENDLIPQRNLWIDIHK